MLRHTLADFRWTSDVYADALRRCGVEGFATHANDYCINDRKFKAMHNPSLGSAGCTTPRCCGIRPSPYGPAPYARAPTRCNEPIAHTKILCAA